MSEINLYPPEEAAAFLEVSTATLRYYRRNKRIAGIRVGNGYVYTRAALEAFKRELDSGERPKPGPKPRKKSKQADGDPPSV